MAAISNNEIKRIKSLNNKKFRDSLGLFAVEGEKMVEEALHSPFEVERIYRKSEIGEEAMARISQLSSPSPVLALVRTRKPVDNDVAGISETIGPSGLYLGLDSIRDPGNLGTIIRVAEWFGVDAVFASKGTVDLYNPKVVQATMGAIFRVNFFYTDLSVAAGVIKQKGGKVYGTFLDGRNIYGTALETGRDCPVMVITGNESEGISAAVEASVSDRLFIPPYPIGNPGSESLNAAIATAVTLAEFRRLLSV